MFDREGAALASTLSDEEATRRLVQAGKALLEAASEARGEFGAALVQLEVAAPEGSVFVVCDRERAVVAVTRPQPTSGLVFYDLKSCLRAVAAEEGDGKPRPTPAASPAAQASGEGESGDAA
ncbi:MAG: hypothetical protein C4305_10035 [Thermoleophilia bacterium]